MIFYYGLIFGAVLLAAAGQVLLKLGAGASGLDLGMLRLNLPVCLGLAAMTASMLLCVRGLSVVPLRDLAFILPTVYLVVPLYCRIFLKEKLRPRTIIGTLVLIMGIAVFNYPTGRLL